MKFTQWLILVGVLWSISALCAGDSFYNGNRLFDYCNASDTSCTGYIAGVIDTLMVINFATGKHFICPPEHIELG